MPRSTLNAPCWTSQRLPGTRTRLEKNSLCSGSHLPTPEPNHSALSAARAPTLVEGVLLVEVEVRVDV